MLAKLEAVLGECWPEVLTVRTERKVRTITTEEKQEPKMSIKSSTKNIANFKHPILIGSRLSV